MKKIVLVLSVLLVVSAVNANVTDFVTGLYNTGLDQNGEFSLSGDGENADFNYVFTSDEYKTPVAYAINKHDAWVAPVGDSRWIAPTKSSISDPVGFYSYTLTFTIKDVNPQNVIIKGLWATDNSAFMSVNGNLISQKDTSGFKELTAFEIDSMFLQDKNVLLFEVYNAEGTSGNPTGLLVSGMQATVVPVPGAFLLGGLGIGCVSYLKRRRSL